MPFERWSQLRYLLVIGLDAPEAIQPALTILQQTLGATHLTVLGCTADWKEAPIDSHGLRLCPDLETRLAAQYETIHWMRDRKFDGAIVFTAAGRSPYALAYLCYLAGIPVRIGQSLEFGGGVLSHCFTPPDASASVNPHLALLRSAGLATAPRR